MRNRLCKLSSWTVPVGHHPHLASPATLPGASLPGASCYIPAPAPESQFTPVSALRPMIGIVLQDDGRGWVRLQWEDPTHDAIAGRHFVLANTLQWGEPPSTTTLSTAAAASVSSSSSSSSLVVEGEKTSLAGGGGGKKRNKAAVRVASSSSSSSSQPPPPPRQLLQAALCRTLLFSSTGRVGHHGEVRS